MNKNYTFEDLENAYLSLTQGGKDVAQINSFYYSAKDLKKVIDNAKIKVQLAEMGIDDLNELEKFAIFVILVNSK